MRIHILLVAENVAEEFTQPPGIVSTDFEVRGLQNFAATYRTLATRRPHCGGPPDHRCKIVSHRS